MVKCSIERRQTALCGGSSGAIVSRSEPEESQAHAASMSPTVAERPILRGREPESLSSCSIRART